MATASKKISVRASAVEAEASKFALDETRMLRRRQNEQIILYLIVCLAIIAAWLIGSWEMSFLWVFGVMIATFLVWRGKVMTLTEQTIRQRETVLHRRRALRQMETAEWLNFVINRWWVFSGASISDAMKKHLNPILKLLKPCYVDSIVLSHFSLGSDTPQVHYVRAYECMDAVGGGKTLLTRSKVGMSLEGLSSAHAYEVVVETHFSLHADDFLMIFSTRLGGKWLGKTVDVALDKLYVKGKLQIILQLDKELPFPHVASASLSFLERPEVGFGIRTLKVMSIMEIPLLKSWIYHMVMDGVVEAFVDPGKVDIDLMDNEFFSVPNEPAPKLLAEGVLTVVVRGEYVASTNDKEKKDRKSKQTNEAKPASVPAMEDLRQCVVGVGSQSKSSVTTQGNAKFTVAAPFLVNNVKMDKLSIKVDSRVLIVAQSVAEFDVPLSSLTFEKSSCCEISREKQVNKIFGGDNLRLSISLQYDALPSASKLMDHTAAQQPRTADIVSGVVYVCMHNATGLLSIDELEGTSPYCVFYCNGKKTKTTHFLSKTRNPKWDVPAEVIIEDISQTCLMLAVYNWNGLSNVDDEFLGVTHFALTTDEPMITRKSANLTESTLIGQQTPAPDAAAAQSKSLGTITYTAIFRPVASVAESGRVSRLASVSPVAPDVFEATTTPLLLAEPVKRGNRSSKKSTADGNANIGSGIVELHVIRAKDLMAKDTNGFSDPFFEVRLNGQKRHTSAVRKKTLEPVWEEKILWDHDVLKSNDLLGSVTFTLEKLKQIALDIQHDGWFLLDKAESGSIQLRIKVFADDFTSPLDIAKTIMNLDSGVSSGNKTPKRNAMESFLKGHTEGNEPSPSKGKLNASDGDSSFATSFLTTSTVESPPPPQPSVTVSTPDNDALGGSHKLPRKSPSTSPVRRINSEAQINGGANGTGDQLSPGIEMPKSKSSSGLAQPSAGVTEYKGVRGLLKGIKGAQNSSTPVYCKVRLVSSQAANDRNRKSMSSHVIAKSPSFAAAPQIHLDVAFEVDNGLGISRDALLLFDVKSGHFSRLATKTFSLQELLGDKSKEVSKWLPLDNAIEVKVQLQYEELQAAQFATLPRRSHSFLGSIRGGNPLKKIKEQ